jgi:hypothetical protein
MNPSNLLANPNKESAARGAPEAVVIVVRLVSATRGPTVH